MDETMKIYNPISKFVEPDVIKAVDAVIPSTPKHEAPKPESKWKYFLDGKVWKEVIEAQAKETRALNKKYPWFPIFYNWLCVMCVVALCIGFIIWGVNIHTEKTAQAYAQATAEQKDAEHQAYLDQLAAQQKAEAESIENIMKKNATAKAKLGYGSRNFKDNKNYGDDDFMTLYQCVDNRLRNSMYTGMSIEEIVFQEGQFIASYDTNPIQDYYYNLAMKSEKLKQDRASEPVGSDYVYTIYTDHGIYLANDPNAPAYTWWHYSE